MIGAIIQNISDIKPLTNEEILKKKKFIADNDKVIKNDSKTKNKVKKDIQKSKVEKKLKKDEKPEIIKNNSVNLKDEEINKISRVKKGWWSKENK